MKVDDECLVYLIQRRIGESPSNYENMIIMIVLTYPIRA